MEASKSRIALLSNINMNFIIRMLSKELEIYQPAGYGNELGELLNKAGAYHTYDPHITFLMMELMELLHHDTENGKVCIDQWFDTMIPCLRQDRIYYISDAYLWGQELAVWADMRVKRQLEAHWTDRLEQLCHERGNVRILPYREILEELGWENACSMKTWYMGKLLHSSAAQRRLADLILHKVSVEGRTAKKVLVLDLDNTLWGGLAGEREHTPLVLSEEHEGAAYKNLQRVISAMERQGVLLAIASKNNQEDAMDVIENHPHMILGRERFAAVRINWEPKAQTISQIAQELNIGLDSMVFWDDSPAERDQVRSMLPQVCVPEFPERAEELAPAMIQIYHDYFEKAVITGEDREKTRQYEENARRQEALASATDFEGYLRGLEMKLIACSPAENLERMTQLFNKTNQFNLTTVRHSRGELAEWLSDGHHRFYLYRVTDRFGDNGIVAAAIVGLGEIPVIEEFVMSCRVMGRRIEEAIIGQIEEDMREEGFTELGARFLPTAKNKPVDSLYEGLGYRVRARLAEGGAEYSIDLTGTPRRDRSICSP